MVPGYLREREARDNAYQHVFKRQVADQAKSELQNTALVLTQLKSQNKRFEDHIQAMEQLTDVLNSNIGLFSRRDEVDVYKKIKEEIWEETAGPNGREKKQAYNYFHHVFSETPALGGMPVEGTQLIKQHIRHDGKRVKLKPLKMKLQSEEARKQLVKLQVDNTFHK